MNRASANDKVVSFGQAFIPIVIFFALVIYGLFIHPIFLNGQGLPIEILVLIAICFTALYLFRLGFTWKQIQDQMVKKVGESIPVILILLSVGVLIGSWIISGTIPMLIYHGISWVNPNMIYLYSFFICILFSLLTGTSWGSAGTIGIVMLGIAQVYEASLPITAAAIVGGAFFGDKLSPLSDTTNIASLATDVKLQDHIYSMLFTTIPSAVLTAIIYAIMSLNMNIKGVDDPAMLSQVNDTLTDIRQLFRFNVLLLLPMFMVIWGSITRKPIVLTLLGSAWIAMVLALVFQDFSLNEVFQTFNKGFSVEMAEGVVFKSDVVNILNRGGLYNLIEGVIICLLIFAFLGMLETIDAINICINKLMKSINTRRQAVVSALSATLVTNLTTSNQFATSFIIGTAFKSKFDKLKIDRKVLSRSLEDAGTMMENLAPWTPSGIFMAGALGVTALEYAPYQFMSWINIVIAYFFAFTGIACFKKKQNEG